MPVQEAMLKDDTLQALKALEGKIDAAGSSDLDERFARIQDAIKQTEKIKDDTKRDTALAVIKANLDTLLADSQKEEADLAEKVNQLDLLIEQIGGDFEKLANLNEEELALINTAQANLDGIKSGWLVINRAAKLKTYEDLLAEAKLEAARRMRKRLMSMSFEQSTQILQHRTAESIRIMEKRRVKIVEQLANVTARKKVAFKIMQEQAAVVQDLVAKATRVDERLHAAEKDLAENFVNGTPEYAAQQTKVSNLREEATNVNGQVNIAKDLHGSKERFALQLEVHEIAQTKVRDNLAIWISGLRSDMEERVHTINSRLEAAKAMSDQELASNFDKLGAKLDQTNTEYMAKVGRISDDLRLRRAEAQGPRMRALEDVHRGQAAANQETREREDKVFAEFEKKYNIDPTAGWFSRPAGAPASAPTAS